MEKTPAQNAQENNSESTQKFLIGVGVGILVLTIILVTAAILLAIYAETTAPGVEVIRDLMIIALTLELIVIGAALTVFIVQVARFVNLLNNEVQPIITSTQDTINTVRGTAIFLSKNVSEPIIQASATLRGIGKVLDDIDAISKAVGVAAAAASPTGARSGQQPGSSPAEQSNTNENTQSASPSKNDADDASSADSSEKAEGSQDTT